MDYFKIATEIGRAHRYIQLTQGEVETLQAKIEELKEQVHELLFERDLLWQKVNQLEHPERWD